MVWIGTSWACPRIHFWRNRVTRGFTEGENSRMIAYTRRQRIYRQLYTVEKNPIERDSMVTVSTVLCVHVSDTHLRIFPPSPPSIHFFPLFFVFQALPKKRKKRCLELLREQKDHWLAKWLQSIWSINSCRCRLNGLLNWMCLKTQDLYLMLQNPHWRMLKGTRFYDNFDI